MRRGYELVRKTLKQIQEKKRLVGEKSHQTYHHKRKTERRTRGANSGEGVLVNAITGERLVNKSDGGFSQNVSTEAQAPTTSPSEDSKLIGTSKGDVPVADLKLLEMSGPGWRPDKTTVVQVVGTDDDVKKWQEFRQMRRENHDDYPWSRRRGNYSPKSHSPSTWSSNRSSLSRRSRDSRHTMSARRRYRSRSRSRSLSRSPLSTRRNSVVSSRQESPLSRRSVSLSSSRSPSSRPSRRHRKKFSRRATRDRSRSLSETPSSASSRSPLYTKKSKRGRSRRTRSPRSDLSDDNRRRTRSATPESRSPSHSPRGRNKKLRRSVPTSPKNENESGESSPWPSKRSPRSKHKREWKRSKKEMEVSSGSTCVPSPSRTRVSA
eukprot:GHVN01024359.1.p1 GENE.GHVN01024359.1~~GHVN01024359.1.p1  ORF type:complete len:378 (-),score=46.65 GHVN01024359.1:84-1217(-)